MADDAKRIQAMHSQIALQGITIKQETNSEGVNWGPEDLAMAARDIIDMGEKCMINFIALGDLAKAAHDHASSLMASKIQVAIMQRQLTPEIKSLFKTWGFEKTKFGYVYYFSPPIKWHIKIPIEVRVIKNHYQFLDNPDMGWFGVDDFKIPNPFDTYWKSRHLIK